MQTLQDIEVAIARLPAEEQRRLIADIPALCPQVFPTDGWNAILHDEAPRPALTSLLDRLDADYGRAPERFAVVDEASLCDRT
jgi:hypothetical protein